jgi:hypothetical protein
MKKESKKFTVPNTFKKDKSHFYATNSMLLPFPDGGKLTVAPTSQNMNIAATRNLEVVGKDYLGNPLYNYNNQFDPSLKVGIEKFNILPNLGKKFVPLYGGLDVNVPYSDPSKAGITGTIGFSGERTGAHKAPVYGYGELQAGYSGDRGAEVGTKLGADIFLSRTPLNPKIYANDTYPRETLVGRVSPHLRAGVTSGANTSLNNNFTWAYGAEGEVKYKFPKFPGVPYAKAFVDFDPAAGTEITKTQGNVGTVGNVEVLNDQNKSTIGFAPLVGGEVGMRFPINTYKNPAKEKAQAKAREFEEAEKARVKRELELQRYQQESQDAGGVTNKGKKAKVVKDSTGAPKLYWESPTGQAEGPAQEQFQNVRGFTPTADFANGGYMAPILPSPMANPDTKIFRDTTALPFGYGGNMYAKGGPIKPLGISDPQEYAYRKAAYDDSLYLYKNNLQPLSLNSLKHYGTYKGGVNLKPYRSQKSTSKYTGKPFESIAFGAYGANDEYRSVPIYVDHVKKYQGTSPAFINYNKSKNFTKQIPVNKPIKIDKRVDYFYPQSITNPITGNTSGFFYPGQNEQNDARKISQTAARFKKPVQPVYFSPENSKYNTAKHFSAVSSAPAYRKPKINTTISRVPNNINVNEIPDALGVKSINSLPIPELAKIPMNSVPQKRNFISPGPRKTFTTNEWDPNKQEFIETKRQNKATNIGDGSASAEYLVDGKPISAEKLAELNAISAQAKQRPQLTPAEIEQMQSMSTQFANGGMLKRADGSYSKRGLWDNIRANAGSGKAPTKQMLAQEKKINREHAYGGSLEGGRKTNLPEDNFMKGGRNIYDSVYASSLGDYYEEGGYLDNQVPVQNTNLGVLTASELASRLNRLV